MPAGGAHDVDDAVIGTRVIEQLAVVDLEEPVDGAGILRNARRRQRPADQDFRAFSNHPGHGVERKRRCAKLAEQLVDRVAEVARRVDERAVEVEGDQAPV